MPSLSTKKFIRSHYFIYTCSVLRVFKSDFHDLDSSCLCPSKAFEVNKTVHKIASIVLH